MEASPLALLQALCHSEVKFILVGGLSAVLHGAPLVTQDVDIVPSRAPANLERLLAVLGELDAAYRTRPELRPGISHLASPGHQNLVTRHGWLDVLGTVGQGLGYEELISESEPVEVGAGLLVQVLSLERYIALKEALGGEKDRAMLPLLRRTLQEQRKPRG
ncbi:MAG TPA: hypothetical protein VN690_05085 [Terriglobales bacterium]|nr:hypothetical protein [Terriglobales bacterium]